MGVHRGLAGVEAEITTLKTALQHELQRALKPLQEQHILNYLRGRLVERADLKGIGPTLKERLAVAGFRTAAEIDPNHGVSGRRVEGIGWKKNASLIHWRHDLERAAARSMPQSLSATHEAQLRARYTAQIEPLQRQRAQLEAVVNSESLVVRLRYATSRADVEKESLGVQPAIDVELRAARNRYASELAAIGDKIQRLEAAALERLRETDGRIMRIERDLTDLRFGQESKRREVQALADVSFGSYLRRVFATAA